MTEQEDTRKKARRDLLLVLLILPLGVLCMFVTGQAAIRLAPKWVLSAEMRSLLDPNAEFAAGGVPFSILPLNPNILTRPAWGDLFLTPNVTIPPRIIFTATPTPPPPPRTPPPVRYTPGNDPEPTTTGGPIKPTPGERQEADLKIEKSDNSRTYTPGTSINYTILVTNLGPHPALTFNVIDDIPAVISGLSVNCTPARLCGTNTSNGNLVSFVGANLPFPSDNQITITISGQVSSGASGDLVNTAEIVIPSGSRYKDPNSANNTATDTDSRLAVHDLAITKGDGSDTYMANTPINYTIVVTNSGPSDALGIRIRDNIPPQIASWDWSCTMVNATGCTGVTGSTTNFIDDMLNIQIGGRIEYTAIANPALLPQNPEKLSNTARIIIPQGRINIDPDLSNNLARDTDIPYIDLQIVKTDVPPGNTFTPGGPLTYTVTVTNTSTFNLTGVSVTDILSPMFSAWTWSCAAGPGASCTPGPSNTNINETAVTFPPGGIVTYTIAATVHANAVGTLENTATVNPQAGLVDAVPGDNTATDSNIGPAMGPPDGNYPPWTEGDPPIILVFGPPIVADGDVGVPDFVYYEVVDPINPGFIALDWIQIDISTDGASWIPVFNWVTGTPPDTNSNVAGACAAEDDNCLIPFGSLYNQTGITIDVDPLVAAGSYSWIRLTAPPSPGGDAPEVDAIQPYYP
jgi:uncharacterized repeat protein (TIGR01451 family)